MRRPLSALCGWLVTVTVRNALSVPSQNKQTEVGIRLSRYPDGSSIKTWMPGMRESSSCLLEDTTPSDHPMFQEAPSPHLDAAAVRDTGEVESGGELSGE